MFGNKLLQSTMDGDLSSIKSVLQKKPKDLFQVTDKNGNNSVHVAATYGQTKVMSYLLGHTHSGKAVKSYNRDGFTPLHCAIENDQDDIVKLFVRAETGLEYSTKNGITSKALCKKFQSEDCLYILNKAKDSLFSSSSSNGSSSTSSRPQPSLPPRSRDRDVSRQPPSKKTRNQAGAPKGKTSIAVKSKKHVAPPRKKSSPAVPSARKKASSPGSNKSSSNKKGKTTPVPRRQPLPPKSKTKTKTKTTTGRPPPPKKRISNPTQTKKRAPAPPPSPRRQKQKQPSRPSPPQSKSKSPSPVSASTTAGLMMTSPRSNSSTNPSEFILACHQGRINQVRSNIGPMVVNAMCPTTRMTALHSAIVCSDLNRSIEVVKLLLSEPLCRPIITCASQEFSYLGFSLPGGASPLHWAVVCGRVPLVKVLVGDPRVKVVGILDWQGRSPYDVIELAPRKVQNEMKSLLKPYLSGGNAAKKGFLGGIFKKKFQVDEIPQFKSVPNSSSSPIQPNKAPNSARRVKKAPPQPGKSKTLSRATGSKVGQKSKQAPQPRKAPAPQSKTISRATGSKLSSKTSGPNRPRLPPRRNIPSHQKRKSKSWSKAQAKTEMTKLSLPPSKKSRGPPPPPSKASKTLPRPPPKKNPNPSSKTLPRPPQKAKGTQVPPPNRGNPKSKQPFLQRPPPPPKQQPPLRRPPVDAAPVPNLENASKEELLALIQTLQSGDGADIRAQVAALPPSAAPAAPAMAPPPPAMAPPPPSAAGFKPPVAAPQPGRGDLLASIRGIDKSGLKHTKTKESSTKARPNSMFRRLGNALDDRRGAIGDSDSDDDDRYEDSSEAWDEPDSDEEY